MVPCTRVIFKKNEFKCILLKTRKIVILSIYVLEKSFNFDTTLQYIDLILIKKTNFTKKSAKVSAITLKHNKELS